MPAILKRLPLSSTDEHEAKAIALLQNPSLIRAVFFAGDFLPNVPDEYHEIASANAPSVSILFEIDCPGIGMMAVVADGNFLTAARGARSLEVSAVLDAAMNVDNVYFSPDRPPCTGLIGMSDEETYFILSTLRTTPLIGETRAHYWNMLSTVPERSYDERHPFRNTKP